MEKVYSPIEIIQHNVSLHELDLINKYVAMIFHWNKKINITSRHTTKEQIYDFVCEGIALTKILGVEKSVSIADVGSGAGFPGMILGILGYKNTNLIEINTKKAAFLQYVSAELNLGIKIHNKDVKSMHLGELDFITSKAVASTRNFIEMCQNINSTNTKIVLCKNVADLDCELKNITLESKGLTVEYRFVLC
jgi:16S rRNA (guanine(527)-N(7))-methyltransferase RsmG